MARASVSASLLSFFEITFAASFLFVFFLLRFPPVDFLSTMIVRCSKNYNMKHNRVLHAINIQSMWQRKQAAAWVRIDPCRFGSVFASPMSVFGMFSLSFESFFALARALGRKVIIEWILFDITNVVRLRGFASLVPLRQTRRSMMHKKCANLATPINIHDEIHISEILVSQNMKGSNSSQSCSWRIWDLYKQTTQPELTCDFTVFKLLATSNSGFFLFFFLPFDWEFTQSSQTLIILPSTCCFSLHSVVSAKRSGPFNKEAIK